MNEDSMPMPEGNNRTNILAVVGILVVIGIIGFVMMQNSANPTAPEDAMENTEVMDGESMEKDDAMMEDEAMMEGDHQGEAITEDAMMADEEGVVVIEMEGGSFYYDADEVTVKLGDTVRIVLNSADMTHDINIDEFDVHSEIIAAGETTTVEFVADQVGEFEYYCGVGSHRQLGMVGTLIVEE